jgi:hypothetical protein
MQSFRERQTPKPPVAAAPPRDVWGERHGARLADPLTWTTVSGAPRSTVVYPPVPGMTVDACVATATERGYFARPVKRAQCTCDRRSFFGDVLASYLCACPVEEWVEYSLAAPRTAKEEKEEKQK